jgi:ankyrin repeat protein
MFYASVNGDVKLLEILKNSGWKLKSTDMDGRTPLHLASVSGNIDAVSMLVSNGADVMAIDSRGNDPVKDSVIFQHQEIHEYLDSVISESVIKQSCTTF